MTSLFGVSMKTLTPLVGRQRFADEETVFEIYQSLLENPFYIFDKHTHRIAVVKLKNADKTGKRDLLETYLTFGDTELKVRCKNVATGEDVKHECVYDYV